MPGIHTNDIATWQLTRQNIILAEFICRPIITSQAFV